MKHCILGFLLANVITMPCLADDVENVRVATSITEAINARDLAALDDFATVSDSAQVIDIRFEDGKVAEIWVEWDYLFALSQLGHFPPSEE